MAFPDTGKNSPIALEVSQLEVFKPVGKFRIEAESGVQPPPQDPLMQPPAAQVSSLGKPEKSRTEYIRIFNGSRLEPCSV